MKKINFILILVISIFITGCSFSKNNVTKSIEDFLKTDSIQSYNTIGKATYETAFDLSNLKNLKNLQKRKVIVTSLVDVNNLKQSSNFGRLYSESIISDLRNKNWDVIDFRGTKVTSMSKTGEFYLDRKKLTSFPKDSFVFIGTYGEYKKGLLINQRLIHMSDNKVITALSLLLQDNGESLELSKNDNCKNLECSKEEKEDHVIFIVEDDCLSGKNCTGDQK